tara:strand:+ start:14099 stop:14950 length:852 start_codon:yes stop_codon:yes gene_type:complete
MATIKDFTEAKASNLQSGLGTPAPYSPERTPIDIASLENLEMDSARSAEETEALLQYLRQRQKQATGEDVAFAKSLKSVGEAGIKGLKTRRDFLLARRGDPSITLKDFLLSPEKSAVAMKSGVDRIVAEKSPAISLKETFGLDKERGFQLLKPAEEILPGDARLSADTRSMNILGKLDANKATPEQISEAMAQARERLEGTKETVEMAKDLGAGTDMLGDASARASTPSSLDIAKDVASIATKGATVKNLTSILGTGLSFINPIAGLGVNLLGTALGTSKYNR